MSNTPKTTKVITGIVRLSFVNLLEKGETPSGDMKYSTQIWIPKEDTVTLGKIENAIEAAKESGKAKWGGKIPANLNQPLRDGDEEVNDDGESKVPGHYFMNCSSINKPGIIDRFKQPVDDPERVYSGVYARVSINFFGYSAAGNKGISGGLNNVQIIKDGEFLGGRASADADFDEFELEEEDDLM
ncbi:DUF2815 family protein [Lactococcus petauri]|uniref:DUF2815 family protein n=1 Tax=Lactococcus petauri TaxID=1940789 RepID=UPI0031FE857F